MRQSSACSREQMIEKLKEMNFYGPIESFGNEYMLYHGQALAIPAQEEFSIAQFRFLLREVEGFISKEEWKI